MFHKMMSHLNTGPKPRIPIVLHSNISMAKLQHKRYNNFIRLYSLLLDMLRNLIMNAVPVPNGLLDPVSALKFQTIQTNINWLTRPHTKSSKFFPCDKNAAGVKEPNNRDEVRTDVTP